MADKNHIPTNITEWLGFSNTPDYSKARPLGIILGVLLIVLIALIFVMGSMVLYQFFRAAAGSTVNSHEEIRNIGLVVAALFGVPFVIWRATVAQKQADVAEQSHITDRISKAVEQLGAEKSVNRIGRPLRIRIGCRTYTITKPFESEPSLSEYSEVISKGEPYKKAEYFEDVDDVDETVVVDYTVQTWREVRTDIEWQAEVVKLDEKEQIEAHGEWQVFSETQPNIEVRLGGIYALERIGKDSPQDHLQIMEILTAYVRGNSPAKNLTPTEPPFAQPLVRLDIQAIVSVLARRSESLVAIELKAKHRIDLCKCDLSGANFNGGNFAAAKLHQCKLEACNFRDCNLTGTQFFGSLLNFSEFWDADLIGTRMDHTITNRSIGRDPSSIGFPGGNILGVSVAGADLSALDSLGGTDKMNKMIGSSDTVLSDNIDESWQEFLQLQIAIRDAEKARNYEKVQDLKRELVETGFSNWFQYPSTNLAFTHYRAEFLKTLGLKG